MPLATQWIGSWEGCGSINAFLSVVKIVQLVSVLQTVFPHNGDCTWIIVRGYCMKTNRIEEI